MSATIISGHRQVPTFGMAGGSSGKVGMNFIQRCVLNPQGMPEFKRKEPKLEFLRGCTDIQMKKGDVFCIHTPGGGGFGPPSDNAASKGDVNDKE
jgi:N-methylhydantoinase B/oxoprolinase/acetone carboxylase alpha subunit